MKLLTDIKFNQLTFQFQSMQELRRRFSPSLPREAIPEQNLRCFAREGTHTYSAETGVLLRSHLLHQRSSEFFLFCQIPISIVPNQLCYQMIVQVSCELLLYFFRLLFRFQDIILHANGKIRTLLYSDQIDLTLPSSTDTCV